MVENNYWSQVLRGRIGRRRAILSAGGAAAGALLAAACGDDDSTSSSTGSPSTSATGAGATGATGGGATGPGVSPAPSSVTSGLLDEPIDTTANAVKGGTWSTFLNADPPHFDSTGRYNNLAYAQNLLTYSLLVDNKLWNVPRGETYPLWAFEGDGAASWEYSGDGTTLVWKLRPDLKTDPRPPTNGRVLDSEDVKFSWDRFSEFSPRRGEILNSVNANAPVVSASYPDESTVVWELAFPSPVLFQKLNRFLLLTREGDAELSDGYDPAATMRGSGPFMQVDYEPSVRVNYERNPNYWRTDAPLVDRLEQVILVEASQQEAQFLAGRVDLGAPPPERRVQTKKDFPQLQLMLDPHLPFGNGSGTWMDYRPGSPWLDDRLRKALSMLIDRDLYIETFFNVEGYAKDGIDVGAPQWHSHINAPLAEFWLDPRKAAPEGLGESGKWWNYDPAEARKLVEAAVGSTPVEALMHKLSTNNYGLVYHEQAQVMANMFNEGDIFSITLNPVDYATVFTPKISSTGNPTGGHDFEGLAFGAIGGTAGGYADPDATWGTHFTPGGTFYKFEENFVEQRFLELNQRQSQEMDEDARIEIVKEAQRFLADWFPIILFPGLTKGVQLYQPWHGNAGVHITRNNEAGGWNSHFRYRWVDESKM